MIHNCLLQSMQIYPMHVKCTHIQLQNATETFKNIWINQVWHLLITLVCFRKYANLFTVCITIPHTAVVNNRGRTNKWPNVQTKFWASNYPFNSAITRTPSWLSGFVTLEEATRGQGPVSRYRDSHLREIMGIPILVRGRLYIETRPFPIQSPLWRHQWRE